MTWVIIKNNKIIGYGLIEKDVIRYAENQKASVYKKVNKYDFTEKQEDN